VVSAFRFVAAVYKPMPCPRLRPLLAFLGLGEVVMQFPRPGAFGGSLSVFSDHFLHPLLASDLDLDPKRGSRTGAFLGSLSGAVIAMSLFPAFVGALIGALGVF
jgi:hypothetical protein